MNPVGTAPNAGSCLGDCSTNVFSLASTKGLRWKRFCSSSLLPKTLSEDPVLTSYSNALACGILCTWRCTSMPTTPLLAADDSCSLALCAKEITVFWYGNEPHWASLISPLLREVERGSADQCWSVDHQALFYQALHDMLERNLAKCGVRRMGEWFVEVPDGISAPSNVAAFRFHFFVYGESTIVVSVNVRSYVAVRKLNADDIATACSNGGNVPVVLSPHGLHGKLTGKTLSKKDSACVGLVEDWEKFFPSDTLSEPCPVDILQPGQPCLAEVSFEERLMLYPLHLISVPDQCSAERQVFSNQMQQQKVKETCCPKVSRHLKVYRKEKSSRGMLRQILRRLSVNSEKPRAPVSGIKTEGANSSDLSTKPLWEFNEGNRHLVCGCLSSTSSLRVKPAGRFTSLSQKQPGPSNVGGGATPNQSSTKKDQRKPTFAFHQRTLAKDSEHQALPIIQKSRRLSSVTLACPVVTSTSSAKVDSPAVTAASNNAHSSTPVATTMELPLPLVHTEKQAAVAVDMHKFDANANVLDTFKYSMTHTTGTSVPYLLPTTLNPPKPCLTSTGSDDNQWDAHLRQLFSSTEDHASERSCIDLTANSSSDESAVSRAKPPEDNRKASGNQTSVKAKTEPSTRPGPTGKKRKSRAKSRQGSNTQSPVQGYASPQNDPFAPVFDEAAKDGNSQPKRQRTTSSAGDTVALLSPPSVGRSTGGRSKKGQKQKAAAMVEHLTNQKHSQAKLPDPSPTLPGSESAFASLPSPPTPQLSCPTPRHSSNSLKSTKDLTVLPDDLYRLFDNSDEEGHGSLFDCHDDYDLDATIKKEPGLTAVSCVDSSPGMAFLDDPHASGQGNKGPGSHPSTFTQHDLAQMFPTPPSQEASTLATSPAMTVFNDHHTHLSSVMSHSGVVVSPDRMTSSTALHYHSKAKVLPRDVVGSECNTGSHALSSDIPSLLSYPVCDMFGPLKDLPSSKLPSLSYGVSLPRYIPTWRTASKQQGNLLRRPSLDVVRHSHKPTSDSSLAAVVTDLLGVPLPTPGELSSVCTEQQAATPKPPINDQSLELILSMSTLCNMKCAPDDVASTQAGMSILPYNFRSSLVSSACMFTARTQLSSAAKMTHGHLIAGDEACQELSSCFYASSSPGAGGKCKPSLVLPLTKEKDLPLKALQFSQTFELYLDQYSTPLTALFTSEMVEHHYVKSDTSPTGSGKQTEPPSFSDRSKSHVDEMLPKLQSALSLPLQKGTGGLKLEGPLSFQALHKNSGKVGLQNRLNVHPLLIGHESEWMSLSPMALRFWDKLMLEPFAGGRDVAYLVVAPDNEMILNSSKLFFREHSTVYESLNLGRHVPINKTIRDGILRVGDKAMQRLAKEAVDDWFSNDDTAESRQMKTIAQVCKYNLGPYLMTLALDESLLKGPEDKVAEAKSKRHPAHIGVPSLSATSVPEDGALEENKQTLPAIVIYLLDPFSGGVERDATKPQMWSYLGLLKCYADMAASFTEHLKQNVFVQILPVGYVTKAANSRASELTVSKHTQCHYKQLALALYSRCRIATNIRSKSKALTGFGVASSREWLIKRRKSENQLPARLYLPPCVLASAPGVLKEDMHSLQSLSSSVRGASGNVLLCAYAVSHDQQWIIVCVTDRRGELADTCVIRLEPERRSMRRSSAIRSNALQRLWDYCNGFMSFSLLPWRVVFTRLGRPGRGEWRDLQTVISKQLESRPSSVSPRNSPSPTCDACVGATRISLQQQKQPRSAAPRPPPVNLRSVSYVSVEAERHMEVYANNTEEPFGWPSARVFVVPPPLRPSLPPSRCTTSGSPLPSGRVRSPALFNPRPLHPSIPYPFGGDVSGLPDADEDAESLGNLMPLLHSPDDSALAPMSLRQRGGYGAGRVPLANAFQPVQQQQPHLHRVSSPRSVLQPSPPAIQRQSPVNPAAVPLQPLAVGHLVSQQNLIEAMPSHALRNRLCLHPVVIKFHLLSHHVCGDVSGVNVLDTHSHLEILKCIIEQHDALSWLTVAPETGERRSCHASHVYTLMQIYNAIRLLST